MNKFPKNQKGFSAVEAILVLIIVILICVVGWLIYEKQHKTTTTKATAAQSNNVASATRPASKPSKQTTNLYAGWETYCSSYGGLCLKYPPSWTVKTTSEPTSTAKKTDKAEITSPSGNVTVEYQPYCIQMAAPPAGTYTENILSVSTPTGASGFRVVKAISSYQGKNDGYTSESLYLTSSAVVQKNGIAVGVHTDNTGKIDEAAAGFFKNAKSSDPSNLQCINVGSLKNSTGGNYLRFSSTSAARKWFSDNEAQAAAQVLESVSHGQ